MPKSATAKKITQVRPDNKGRITLGSLAEGVSSFRVSECSDGALLLEPMVEIHAREKWLLENKPARESVRKGITQSSKGQTTSRGSFARFAKDESE